MLKNGRFVMLSGAVLMLAACTTNDTTDETNGSQEDGVTQIEESGQEDAATDETSDETEDLDLENAGTDEEVASITVEMYNTEAERVGRAIFDEGENGVTIILTLEDIPAGEYGMHIHEVGMATPPTFEDAGSHFNPTDAEHGFDNEAGHHLGDLPNLVVPENGIVNEVIEVEKVSLLPDVDYTLATEEGTSLIIHTEADDYETDPSGDSGDRMIGGVIFAPQN